MWSCPDRGIRHCHCTSSESNNHLMEEQNVWQPPQYDLSTPLSAKATLHITPDPNYFGNFPRFAMLKFGLTQETDAGNFVANECQS